MEKTIFYSWQSDLPNNLNLNFIEGSIKNVIKNLQSLKPIPIKLKLDKATRDIAGSPDITESIFSKISESNVFVADISIINNSSNNDRKTPNPNVLIELGYAARTLGWENIICVYNTGNGSFDDLPFDLRNRRIMNYSFENKTKADVRIELTKKIEYAVREMHSKGNLTDKILDFLKKEIDQEILGLISHLVRITDPDQAKNNLFQSIQTFLNYSKSDLNDIIRGKKILGFYLFKLFHEYEAKIHDHINQAMSSQYYNREILNSLIDIYEWFAEYDKFRTNYFSKLTIKLNETQDDLFVIKGSEISANNRLPDRFLLMKRVDNKNGQVCNFGDLPPGAISTATNYYSLNDDIIEKYIDCIYLLIISINKWLDVTNNEFIVDFTKNFRIKKTDGEWL